VILVKMVVVVLHYTMNKAYSGHFENIILKCQRTVI
jgi:hypothetical protein